MITNLEAKINAWYSDRVSDSLTPNRKIADTQLSLKISTLKPLHTDWLFIHLILLLDKLMLL